MKQTNKKVRSTSSSSTNTNFRTAFESFDPAKKIQPKIAVYQWKNRPLVTVSLPDFRSGSGSTSVRNLPSGVNRPKLNLKISNVRVNKTGIERNIPSLSYVVFLLCHNESGSFNCRMSICRLSLLILLPSRIMEFSVLFAKAPWLLEAPAWLEAVTTEIALELTPLTSLLMVLSDPTMKWKVR